MPSDTIQRLLEEGQRTGLLSGAVVQQVTAQLAAAGDLTPRDFASRLVEDELLTPYQAEQLLTGHAADCLIAGRYCVLAQLGHGGMGAVYKARDTKLDRLVAIKVMSAQCLRDADAVARFEREARALARLSHPNIIQAFDSGTDGDRHFLVMEFVEGVTLLQVLRERGALSPAVAADFLHQAALGLEHAHGKGLIHRDIKPGNLLVGGLLPSAPVTSEMTVDYRQSFAGALPVLKILDLGLARFLQDQLGDSQLTQEGMGVGTPDYMAPEQFRDSLHADARTDIYGLGCTLYHLIAGQVPFPGSSYSEKAAAHARKEPIPLEERCPEIPAGLAYVVSRMMAKHPDERFTSAGEVAEALAPFVAAHSNSMVHLRQTGTWKPGRLPITRAARRRRAMAGGVTALAALAALVFFAWSMLFGPRNATSQADTSAQDAPKPQVVTIENGLTVAKDGTGQFTTIGEALAKVKPGQTIRVLDDAVYPEFVHLRDRERFEGVALEAPRHAALEFPATAKIGILVLDVPHVTVRGFTVRAPAASMRCVGVGGRSPGGILADLRCSAQIVTDTAGVTIDFLGLTAEEVPVRVENCQFRQLGNGVEVIGLMFSTRQSQATRRVVVKQNDFSQCELGVWGLGLLSDVQIVGNRFWDCSGPTVRLSELRDGSGGLLIANNSIRSANRLIEIVDPDKRVDRIQILGNVCVTGTGRDFLHVDTKGPVALNPKWEIRSNWRQVSRPQAVAEWLDSAADTFVENMPLESLNPKEPNFFRPVKGSPLASGGVGGDLPTYVGAVPPAGIEPWDWMKTWKSRTK